MVFAAEGGGEALSEERRGERVELRDRYLKQCRRKKT